MGDEDLQFQLDMKKVEAESLTEALGSLQNEHETLKKHFEQNEIELVATNRSVLYFAAFTLLLFAKHDPTCFHTTGHLMSSTLSIM